MTPVVAFGWMACAFLGAVALAPAWKPVLLGLVEWEGKQGKLTVGSGSSLAVLGSIGVLSLSLMGGFAGIATLGGGSAVGTAAAASPGPPNTPTVDAVVFAPTGDSLRILTGAFVGSGADTHDSTQFSLDTAGTAIDADSGFASPKVFVSLGAVTTDTFPIPSGATLDSGAVYVVTARHKGVSGGWSAWDDSLSVTMVSNTLASYCSNKPASLSQLTLRTFQGETGYPTNWNGGGTWGVGSPGVTQGNSVEVDATAPLYADSVGTMSFVVGQTADGTAPGSGIYNIQTPQDTLYVCSSLKYSTGFDYHTVGVKLDFFTSDSLTALAAGRPAFLINRSKGGSVRTLDLDLQGDTSATLPLQDTVDIDDNTWYKLEVLLIGHNGGANGEAHMWINGTKTLQVTGFRYSTKNSLLWRRGDGGGFKWEPTWGGNGDSLTANGQIYRSFIYIAGNN